MLNELRLLERGLAEIGMAVEDRHPDLSTLLKADVIRVRLDGAGAIRAVEVLPEPAGGEVWTLRDGNHNGFPGLKTPAGLLDPDAPTRAEHDAHWTAARSPAAKRAELERLIVAPINERARSWPSANHRVRIAERLTLLQPLAEDPATAAVPATFDRFLRALRREPGFVADFLAALRREIQEGSDRDLDAIRRALIGPVPLAIDIFRPVAIGVVAPFARDAGDRRQIEPVSRALDADRTSADAPGQCAFTGDTTRLFTGTFPQPTLPSVGQTYLLSRNRDIPALARYGRNGSSSFPVDDRLVARLSGALAKLTSSEQSGKSWRSLPADVGSNRDLLIAFLASSPEADLADALTSGKEENVGSDDLARHARSQLLRFWDGVATRSTPGEVAHLMILRSVDPGNRKVIYSSRPTVSSLHAAAARWAQAMANVPGGIEWPVFVERQPTIGRPEHQAPLSLIAQSRRLYIRKGTQATDAPAVSGAEALGLFLGGGDRPALARRALRVLLDRQSDLLAATALAARRRELKDFDRSGTARIDALRGVAWLGTLLFLLNHRKEAYMEAFGYKLGQFLAAADLIHMGYCADRRGGDVPPTLIGNSLLGQAGRNPRAVLSTLQLRLVPYLGWVRRTGEVRAVASKLMKEAEDAGASAGADKQGGARAPRTRARRIYGAVRAAEDCADVARSLADQLPGVSLGEEFRAMLLLGYVAGSPSASKGSGGTTSAGTASPTEENDG